MHTLRSVIACVDKPYSGSKGYPSSGIRVTGSVPVTLQLCSHVTVYQRTQGGVAGINKVDLLQLENGKIYAIDVGQQNTILLCYKIRKHLCNRLLPLFLRPSQLPYGQASSIVIEKKNSTKSDTEFNF